MPYSWHTKLTPINTYVCEGTSHYINYGLCIVKSTPINDSLKESCLTLLNLTGSFLKGHVEVRHSLLFQTLAGSHHAAGIVIMQW